MTGSEAVILLIPVALAIVLLAVVSLEKLLLLTLFLAPLSIQLSFITGQTGFDLSVPTEPVMAMLLLITLYKLLVTAEFSKSLLRHPVTVIIAAWLAWTLLTSITSTIPGVSFKSLAYRLWFIAGFYLITAQLFLSGKLRTGYIMAYAAGMALVVAYFLVRAEGAGLMNQKFAHSACYPFFRDHTSFGASLAFLIPPLVVMTFSGRRTTLSGIIPAMLLLLFAAGFIFSYSRAAWVSLLAAVTAATAVGLRMPKRLLSALSATALLILILSAGTLWQKMDSTTEDSSADMVKHLRSSANITTDQSNLERINRWKSALRMFGEKPLAGWGPGTYQFNYAPFQKASEKTVISTDFGDAGNAHSEYLGALSESGLPGALIFLALVVTVILTGVRAWYETGRNREGYLVLAVLAGLLTYCIHGLMNSFLDSDKIASLWWGFTAWLVAADLKGKKPAEGSSSPYLDTKQRDVVKKP